MRAYVVGLKSMTEEYRSAFEQGKPHIKIGYRSGKGDTPAFEGSYVYQGPEDARQALAASLPGVRDLCTVHEILLPNGWEQDTAGDPRRLLTDAVIVG